jgi:hypothetical protein
LNCAALGLGTVCDSVFASAAFSVGETQSFNTSSSMGNGLARIMQREPANDGKTDRAALPSQLRR